MTEHVFLLGLTIVGTTAIFVVRAIAGAIAGRGPSRSELAEIKERLEEHRTALEEAQAGLASQAAQLAELQERTDFAERLLAQSRDRSALGPGERRG